MHHVSVRRRIGAVTALWALASLAACQDKRVKQLDTGITRDSVVSVISQDAKGGAPTDSFPNVYSRERYLIEGKQFEVLYFTPDNQKRPNKSGVVIKDTLPWKELTPLVFIDNKLVGKGWDKWDSISKANRIPVKQR